MRKCEWLFTTLALSVCCCICVKWVSLIIETTRDFCLLTYSAALSRSTPPRSARDLCLSRGARPPEQIVVIDLAQPLAWSPVSPICVGNKT